MRSCAMLVIEASHWQAHIRLSGLGPPTELVYPMLANAAVRAVAPMSARHLAWAWEGHPVAARLPFLQRPRRVPELAPLGVL
jgi:hypothetical protein